MTRWIGLCAGLLALTVGACSSDSTPETGDPATDTGTTTGPSEVVAPPTYEVALAGWPVAVGQEVTMCTVVELGNDEAIHVGAIHTTLRPGSHHLIIYATEEEPSTEPFECEPFSDTLVSQPLMISEIGEERLQLPDGVALPLKAGQRLRLEAHYLNYFPDPIEAGATVSFETVAAEDVVHTAGLALLGTTAFDVPAGGETTTPWVWIDLPNGTELYAVTGHTHQWGTQVEIEQSAGRFEAGTSLYPPADTPFLWDEAPVAQFSPPLLFESGQGLRFRCSWRNEGDSDVRFGLSANDEMCIVWAYYYPSDGYQICLSGLFPPCPNDNGPDGTPELPTEVLMNLHVLTSDGVPMAGATVSHGSQEETTDGSGGLSLRIPTSEPFEVSAGAEGHVTTTSFGHAPAQDFGWSMFPVDRESHDNITASAGLSHDDTRGLVAVAVFQGSETSVVGTRVAIDAEHEGVFARDEEGTLSPSDVLLSDSKPWLLFFNAAAGAATVTVTPPEGLECFHLPNTETPMGDVPIAVRADEHSVVQVMCKP